MDLVNDILMDHSWDPLIIVFTHKEDLIPEQLLKEYKPPGLSKDLAVEFTVRESLLDVFIDNIITISIYYKL